MFNQRSLFKKRSPLHLRACCTVAWVMTAVSLCSSVAVAAEDPVVASLQKNPEIVQLDRQQPEKLDDFQFTLEENADSFATENKGNGAVAFDSLNSPTTAKDKGEETATIVVEDDKDVKPTLSDSDTEPAKVNEVFEEEETSQLVDSTEVLQEKASSSVQTIKVEPEVPVVITTTSHTSDADLKLAVESIRSLSRNLADTFRVVDDSQPSPEQLASRYYIVTPRVTDPRWNQAMDLLIDDRCSEAKKLAEEVVGDTALLTPDTDPGIRYAMARIDLCSNNAARGRKVLEELSKRDDAIGTIASQALGKPKESDPYDLPIERVSDLIQDAVTIGKSGQLETALKRLDDLYDTVSTRRDRFNIRLAQANILENAGKIDQAANLYLQLYRRTRGSSANERIEDRLERLERIAKKTYLTFGERVDRMRHLIDRGRYRDAKELSIYNAKLRGFNESELAGMTNFRLALVAERKRDRKKAVTLFEKANRQIKDDEVRPRIYLDWARALRRLDRDKEAIALYKKLTEEYPDHELAGEAYYQAGRLYQFMHDNQDAIVAFDNALDTLKNNAERDDDPSWAVDALWRSGFSNILLKNWDKAISRLERLRDRFGDETDSSDLTIGLKATYWIAVANLEAGRRELAKSGFQATIDRGKLTWYGRLAAARMDREKMPYNNHLPDFNMAPKATDDGPIEARNSLNNLAVEKDPRLAIAIEYARLGLWRDARAKARPLLNAHPASKGAAAIVASADLIEGDAAGAHWRMRGVIDESGPNDYTLRSWVTAFPNVYHELAERFGKQYNVDPSLVQAIIRQESGFRPRVKSYAGAVGLMQLMPGTARYTAKEFMQDRQYSRHQLTQPEVNVELGTMYIRLQTAFAGDSIPIALAGYNAGSGPQSTWIDRYGDRDLDAWVESITYQEARGYVRKVFTSYAAYSKVYTGVLPNLDLDAPRKLKEKKRVWGDVPELKRPSS